MLFNVVSRKTSPTTNFPPSVTSLKATGTTLGSPFAHVARFHIPSFNNFTTDSFNILYTSVVVWSIILYTHVIEFTFILEDIREFMS